MKVLPVGSVVKARGIKLLIVGYQMFYKKPESVSERIRFRMKGST